MNWGLSPGGIPMNPSELIFYAGIGGMAAAVLLLLLVLLIHHVSGKRLRRELERDYGEKHTD